VYYRNFYVEIRNIETQPFKCIIQLPVQIINK